MQLPSADQQLFALLFFSCVKVSRRFRDNDAYQGRRQIDSVIPRDHWNVCFLLLFLFFFFLFLLFIYSFLSSRFLLLPPRFYFLFYLFFSFSSASLAAYSFFSSFSLCSSSISSLSALPFLLFLIFLSVIFPLFFSSCSPLFSFLYLLCFLYISPPPFLVLLFYSLLLFFLLMLTVLPSPLQL